MDARYRRLEGADTIADLVGTSDQRWPRIVCICDEYSDLTSRSPQERKQIEAQVFRLGAKARAARIHLILATQQPSRETIKGALDTNMPARIGLKMIRHLESHMLLGEAGAEKLLGDGDLLFKDVGAPRRLQAPLLSAANRREIFGAD
jgi:DNA segregation ATPase FtsK/SpoIIIE-like protein